MAVKRMLRRWLYAPPMGLHGAVVARTHRRRRSTRTMHAATAGGGERDNDTCEVGQAAVGWQRGKLSGWRAKGT